MESLYILTCVHGTSDHVSVMWYRYPHSPAGGFKMTAQVHIGFILFGPFICRVVVACFEPVQPFKFNRTLLCTLYSDKINI